jgi:hypothetical protein
LGLWNRFLPPICTKTPTLVDGFEINGTKRERDECWRNEGIGFFNWVSPSKLSRKEEINDEAGQVQETRPESSARRGAQSDNHDDEDATANDEGDHNKSPPQVEDEVSAMDTNGNAQSPASSSRKGRPQKQGSTTSLTIESCVSLMLEKADNHELVASQSSKRAITKSIRRAIKQAMKKTDGTTTTKLQSFGKMVCGHVKGSTPQETRNVQKSLRKWFRLAFNDSIRPFELVGAGGKTISIV